MGINCRLRIQVFRSTYKGVCSLAFHTSPFFHFSVSSKLLVLKANKLATLLCHCSGDECITLPMNRLLSILSEGILVMANRYWTYLVLSNCSSERNIGSLRKFTSIMARLMFLVKFSSSMIKSSSFVCAYSFLPIVLKK